MSDESGSDLDVFKTLSKEPAPARKKTLLGLTVPANLAASPTPKGSDRSSSRSSLPPPPPPSIRSHAAPSRPSSLPPSGTHDPALTEPKPPSKARLTLPPGVLSVDPNMAEPSSRPSAPLPAAPPRPAPSSTRLPTDAPPQADTLTDFSISSDTEITPAPALMEDAPDPNLYEDDDATEVFDGPSISEHPPIFARHEQTPGASTAAHWVPPKATPVPPLKSRPPPKPISSAPLGARSSNASLSDDAQELPPITTPDPPPLSSPGSSPSADDWDDEEDKTTIYSRGEGSDALQALLGPTVPKTSTIPDVPPPPMSRPSAPVPSPPVLSNTATRRLARPATPLQLPTPASVPPDPTPNRTPLVIGTVAVALIALALFLLLKPSTGGLVVTVAGPGNQPLDTVEVALNGKVVCNRSPCKLPELTAGTHMVKSRAAGYQETAATAVLITSGQDAVHNITLVPVPGTGVRVQPSGEGMILFIDGREIGPLPQELKNLSPGKHAIRLESAHFAPYEQTIEVEQNEMVEIGPLKLKVVRGTARVKAGSGAEDARTILQSKGDRRLLPSLPIDLDIETDKKYTLVATKAGYQSYRQDISFEDGVATKTFEIELTELEESAPAPRRKGRPTRRPSPQTSQAKPKASTERATLNINSIPSSKIILDGRPIGTTPKVGISVKAGAHTVVLLRDGKRQTKRINVKPGQTQTVVHRFK